MYAGLVFIIEFIYHLEIIFCIPVVMCFWYYAAQQAMNEIKWFKKWKKVFKGVSSRLLRKEFPELKKELWGNSFWSSSYFIASTGQVSLETLKRYVEEQSHERPSKIKKESAIGQKEGIHRQ